MEEVEHVEILLVEDNPNDAELTMHGLKTEKLFNKVTWLKNGAEALDYLFRRGEFADHSGPNPGLILLDLKMPKVDGLEVLSELKADASTRSIPVVIMTSSQEEQDVAKSYDLGANSYVVKPVDLGALTEVARLAGYYWLVINHRAL